MRGVSPQAVAFVRALVTDEPRRLKTAAEVKAHPWLAGVDWLALEAAGAAAGDAPGPFAEFVPPRLAAALRELEALPRELPRGDERVARLVREVTAQFDDVDKLPDTDPRSAAAGGGGAGGHAPRPAHVPAWHFPAYTFKKSAVVQAAAAPAGGSPDAAAAVAAAAAAAAAAALGTSKVPEQVPTLAPAPDATGGAAGASGPPP